MVSISCSGAVSLNSRVRVLPSVEYASVTACGSDIIYPEILTPTTTSAPIIRGSPSKLSLISVYISLTVYSASHSMSSIELGVSNCSLYGMVNSAFLSKDFLLLSEEVSAASSYRTLTFTIPLRRVLPLLVTISSGSTVAVALRISPICGSFEEISCCSLSIMLPSEINCLSASLIGTFLSSIFEQVFVGALSLSDCRGVNGIRSIAGGLGSHSITISSVPVGSSRGSHLHILAPIFMPSLIFTFLEFIRVLSTDPISDSAVTWSSAVVPFASIV